MPCPAKLVHLVVCQLTKHTLKLARQDMMPLQEVERKVLCWLHEEEATGVQYLEVYFPHSAAAVVSQQHQMWRMFMACYHLEVA